MSINANFKKGAGTVEKSALQINAYGDMGGSSDLPIASADTLGGVKIGNGLSIDSDGVLSAGGGSGDITVFEITLLEDDTPSIDASYNDIVNAGYALFKYIDGEDAVFGLGSYSYYIDDNVYTVLLSYGEIEMLFTALTPNENLTYVSK